MVTGTTENASPLYRRIETRTQARQAAYSPKMPGEYDLLCEQCGYQLDGLESSPNCPECGKPVPESLPEARKGTAWQRKPGVIAWVRTLCGVISHPKSIWRDVRPDTRRSIALLLLNLGVASSAATAGILIPGHVYGAASVFYAVLFLVVAFDVLLVLTLIEVVGIRFYGARRRWRITRGVADAIVAHSSVGWVISGVGLALGWHAWQWVDVYKMAAWIGGVLGPSYFPDYDVIRTGTMAFVLFGGLLVGLMVFEFLVYFGFRRMRYANRRRSVDERNSLGSTR